MWCSELSLDRSLGGKAMIEAVVVVIQEME